MENTWKVMVTSTKISFQGNWFDDATTQDMEHLNYHRKTN